MNKLNILFLTIVFMFLNSISLAEANQDCSQYSKKTLVGSYDKWRCEKGKTPREKFDLKKLNIFKKKN